MIAEVDGKQLELTSLDRVLWPATGTTKRELLDYYRRIAPVLLPHLEGRPLTLWRFPRGVHARGFWQNECRGAPDWLRTVALRGQRFCVADDLPSLLWLVNLGTIELHPFPTRIDEPERPTAIVLDLDPGPPAGILEACAVALRVRAELEQAGLAVFAKTSGSRGLHLVAPVSNATFEHTKDAARELAQRLAAERPDEVVAVPARSLRRGKVFVDWLQNDATRALVAAYSLRATSVPGVSTPVAWAEIEEAHAAQRGELLAFAPAEVLDRVEAIGDLHADVLALTPRRRRPRRRQTARPTPRSPAR